jgi:hypothetical protein
MRLLTLVALLGASLALAGPAPESAFARLPADPPPAEIIRGVHYWVSNENQLELFHDAVKDRQGVYVGVGSDQNYLLAAWARSEPLVLLDFDQAIVDLHRVYRVLFREAATPEDFLRLWGKDSRDEVRRLVEQGYPDARERAAALRVYGVSRATVERRLRRVRVSMKQASLPSFLGDAADYAHIRRLYLEDKVHLVRGDLTAALSVSAVGRAALAEKRTVGVLYLSNAEQYFDYGPQFRANIRGLPLTADSVVVRTSGQRGVSHVKGTYYHYDTQSGSSFLEWLRDSKTRNVRDMLRYAPDSGQAVGLSRLDIGPDAAHELKKQQLLARVQKKKPARTLRKALGAEVR